jgi:hypothetical protein
VPFDNAAVCADTCRSHSAVSRSLTRDQTCAEPASFQLAFTLDCTVVAPISLICQGLAFEAPGVASSSDLLFEPVSLETIGKIEIATVPVRTLGI